MAAKTAKRRAVISWVLVVAWACFIFFMSAHTGSDLSSGDDLVSRIKLWLDGVQAALFGEGVDAVSSIAHFCEYLVFGALICNAFRCHVPARTALVAAVLVASLYGVTDEIHQIFVPGRFCDLVDWAVDMVGAAIGSTLLWLKARSKVSSGTAEEGSGARRKQDA